MPSLICPIFKKKKKKHRHNNNPNKEHHVHSGVMSVSSTDVLGDHSPAGKVREMDGLATLNSCLTQIFVPIISHYGITPRSRDTHSSKSSARSKAAATHATSSSYSPLSIKNDARGTMCSRDDDSSLPTIDPDYNPASDNFSLSDAGGTIGSQSQSLSIFGSQTRFTAGSSSSHHRHQLYKNNTNYTVNNTINNEDYHYYHPYHPTPPSTRNTPTLQQQHTKNATIPKPKLLEIYAPSGKLGVVIDVPLNSTTPLVHAIKDTCPIRKEIQVGDALIAVDDVDVRNMNAVEVSKLISRKSSQEVRKLSVLRRDQSELLFGGGGAVGMVGMGMSGEDVYGLR
ncbi:hypothetical protein ACHAXN_007694 [Cyclotella atomus]